jgi:prolyl oligopeptidase
VLDVGPDGRMYLLTNLGSPRGRLCVGDPAHPEHDNWRDLVRADPEAVLSNFTILDGQDLQRFVLLVSWTRYAINKISVHNLATGERLSGVPLPGLGSGTADSDFRTRPPIPAISSPGSRPVEYSRPSI